MNGRPFDVRDLFAEELRNGLPNGKDAILRIIEKLTRHRFSDAQPKHVAMIMIITFCDLMLIPGIHQTAEEENDNWNDAFLDAYVSLSRWVVKALLVALKRQSDFNIRALNASDFDRMLPRLDARKVRTLLHLGDTESPHEIATRVWAQMPYYVERIDRFAHDGAVLFADMRCAAENGEIVPRAILNSLDVDFTDIRPYRPRRYSQVSIITIGSSQMVRLQGGGAVPSTGEPVAQGNGKVTLQQTARSMTAVPRPPEPTSPVPASREPELLGRISDLETRLQEAIAKAEVAKNESVLADQRNLLKTLKGRIRALQSALTKTGGNVRQEIVFPTSFDDLAAFATEHLGERVVISRRAHRSAVASPFRNVPLAYQVLKMLADDYLPMREGEEGARERFDEACKSLKVSVAPTGMALQAHRTSETYRVTHLGKRYPLDLHVQGNSSFDPRDGFRLYFHVIEDEEDGMSIIVGHFPEHLPNALT